MFAEIVINNESFSTDMLFTYKVKEGTKVNIGQRVKVPFGNYKTMPDGFVIDLRESFDGDLDKLKEIEYIYDEIYFDKSGVDLIKELRKRYLASYLDGVKLLIPKDVLRGMNFKIRQVLYPGKALEGSFKSERYQTIYEKVEKSKGKLIRNDLGKQGFSLSSINTMIKHGFLELIDEKDQRYNVESYKNYKEPTLNSEQTNAVETILKNKGTYLLHGITGSGKTEIFLYIIKKAIEKNEDSIVLLPEISLTPQMIERFKGRFGENITVYHSRLSPGERHDEWHRVKQGKVKVAIGARSALFLPFNNLKNIIIDEEHEKTYKSDMNPKYDAREVSEFMSKYNEGTLILASATPSVETFKRAEDKEITLIELKNRATKSLLPEMEIIDMRQELKSGNKSIFSHKLRNKIQEKLDKNEQIILFLNRRGFSSFVSCRSCGYVFECDRCDISLTYHRGGKLLCHQCGFSRFLPKTCPSCKSKYIKQFGTGTERVEMEVRKYFPKAKTIRMDGDTTKGKNSYDTMYNDFKSGRKDILIGTQMISKGLDFKNVTLVGVLAADLSLNMPDYRSSEDTFQLITQVSGRSGRGEKEGEVIVQTYSPENKAIINAKNYDYDSFYRDEIIKRQALNNPPFSKIYEIALSSTSKKLLVDNIKIVGDLIKDKLKDKSDIIILGPTSNLIGKINNNYRWHIILKGNISYELGAKIKDLVYKTLRKHQRKIKINIDINPTSLM
ncbi:MAG: primosomal protein N' [Clostridium sp.]|nr:primosomal protein N' [Clostridium sp.]